MERLEIFADLVIFIHIIAVIMLTGLESSGICKTDTLLFICPFGNAINIPVQILYSVVLVFFFGGFLVFLPLLIFSIIQKIRRLITTRSFWMSDLWQKSQWVLVALILGGALLWIVA